MTSHTTQFAPLLALLVSLVVPGWAQDVSGLSGGGPAEAGFEPVPDSLSEALPNVGSAEHAQAQGRKEPPNSAFVIAPVPFSSPTIETGLALGVGYLMNTGAGMNVPSAVFGAYAATTNGTRVGVLGGRYVWDKGNNRALAMAFSGEINLDYYPVPGEDVYVPLESRATGGLATFDHAVAPHLLAGLLGLYTELDIGVGALSQGTASPPEPVLDGRMTAMSPRLKWDSRNNLYYPTKGNSGTASLEFHWDEQALGNATVDLNYQAVKLSWAGYHQTDPKGVLAYGLTGNWTSSDSPFYALQTFTAKSLLGYAAGRFNGNLLLAAQAQYRYKVTRSLGLVGTVGVGEVARDFGDLSVDGLLPSIGGGVRYVVQKDLGLNYRVDAAYGESGVVWYFGVGETF